MSFCKAGIVGAVDKIVTCFSPNPTATFTTDVVPLVRCERPTPCTAIVGGLQIALRKVNLLGAANLRSNHRPAGGNAVGASGPLII